MTEENKIADPTITVSIAGQDKEILMSWGLLDELTKLVKDLDQLGQFFSDPEMRDGVLSAVLSERTKQGKITKKLGVLDVELDDQLEAVDEILSWAASHVTAFFIRSLTKLSERVSKLPQDKIEALTDKVLTSTPSGLPS